jgi:hypothetical protein
MLSGLAAWCAAEGVFLHPALRLARGGSVYRDHHASVAAAVPRLTPLMAIPERLCIGFRDVDNEDHMAALRLGGAHRGTAATDATTSGDGDAEHGDACAFFFSALGLLVNDLLVAHNNELTDRRHRLAAALLRTRTLHNAPYLDANQFRASGAAETSMADVFLQMVLNYVQSGPLTGKVVRDELNWAVSVCLSHSTPLSIGGRASIGIVPVVHLLPHGGDNVNAVVVPRDGDVAGRQLRRFFDARCPMLRGAEGAAAGAGEGGRYLYVVATRDLAAGDAVSMQPMAPVCSKEDEAAHMWMLTCGAAPPGDSMPTDAAAALQRDVSAEVHALAAKQPR